MEFTDGSSEEVDLIIFCTGYKITFPFFDHDLLDALPKGSIAGHVGSLLPSTRSTNGPRDHVHVVGPGEVRELLRELAASVSG